MQFLLACLASVMRELDVHLPSEIEWTIASERLDDEMDVAFPGKVVDWALFKVSFCFEKIEMMPESSDFQMRAKGISRRRSL